MNRTILYIIAISLGLLYCSGDSRTTANLYVSVSVQPQKFFVEKIGGDKVEVSVMVPPGADPHVYEPKPQQMVELSKSKLYFATGVDFENSWLDRFASSNPDMKIVHTEENIEKIPMQHIELEISEAEDEDEHAHHDDEGGLDPHIWLSPPSVKSQLDVILENLIETDPDNAGLYRLNYDRFCEEINSLDTELKNMFSGGNIKKEFIVFHPAWGYFARAYGLRQIPVEIEGKEPKPRDLVKLIDYARENEIKVIFVQPQISPQTASMIANEIGGEVVTADPLAENWLENLRNVAQKFKNSMK